MKKTIIVFSLFWYQSGFAGNSIRLNLPDFSSKSRHLNMTFRVSVPPGQKITKGADSHIQIQRQKGQNWVHLARVDLNQSLDPFGFSKPVKISTPIPKDIREIRLKGNLYHCPKPDTPSSSKSYCVIQKITGQSKASLKGQRQLFAHVKGTMIDPAAKN